LDTASRPLGTVTAMVKEALSIGWSLAGNQVAATSGWPMITTPSSVWKTPASPRLGSTMTCGIPS
jgi:hypothetical protein